MPKARRLLDLEWTSEQKTGVEWMGEWSRYPLDCYDYLSSLILPMFHIVLFVSAHYSGTALKFVLEPKLVSSSAA